MKSVEYLNKHLIKNPYKVIAISYFLVSLLRFFLYKTVNLPMILNDEVSYSLMAKGLSLFGDARHYSEYVAFPDLRNALYPGLLAFLFKTHIPYYASVKLINSFIAHLLVFPAYWIAREFMDARRATLTALLILLFPNLNLACFVMPESVYYPLFVLGFFLSYKTLIEKQIYWAVFAGISSAVLISVKPHGACLFLSFLISSGIAFLILDRSKGLLLRTLVAIAVLLLSLCALNWFFWGKFAPMAVVGNYYGGFAGSVLTALGPLKKVISTLTMHLSMVGFLFLIPMSMVIPTLIRSYRIKNRKIFIFTAFMSILTLLLLAMTVQFSVMFVDWRVVYSRYYDGVFPIIFIFMISVLFQENIFPVKVNKWVAFTLGIILAGYFFKIYFPKVVAGPYSGGFFANSLFFVWTRSFTWLTRIGLGLFCCFVASQIVTPRYARFFALAFIVFIILANNFEFFVEIRNMNIGVRNWVASVRGCIRDHVNETEKLVLAGPDAGRVGAILFFWDREYNGALTFQSGRDFTQDLLAQGTSRIATIDGLKVGDFAKLLYSSPDCSIYEVIK